LFCHCSFSFHFSFFKFILFVARLSSAFLLFSISVANELSLNFLPILFLLVLNNLISFDQMIFTAHNSAAMILLISLKISFSSTIHMKLFLFLQLNFQSFLWAIWLNFCSFILIWIFNLKRFNTMQLIFIEFAFIQFFFLAHYHFTLCFFIQSFCILWTSALLTLQFFFCFLEMVTFRFLSLSVKLRNCVASRKKLICLYQLKPLCG